MGIILFLFSLLVFFFGVSHSFAAEGNLGAYPTNFDQNNPKTKSWFIYQLKPGESKDDSITVVNNSDKQLSVRVYAVDATTTSDGAFALLNENQRQNGVGSWVSIAKDIITIEPRSRTDVPFTISIPKYISVGDHAGGIIVQEAARPTTSNKGLGLNIVSRVGTRIYETVPGDKVIKLDLTDFTYKIIDTRLVFTFNLANQGNVILNPTGDLEVKDYTGKTIDKITLGNLGSVFPGKPTAITVKSTKTAPLFGQYTAVATVDYSPIESVSKSLTFFIYVNDWRYALLIPFAILALLIFFRVRKIIPSWFRNRRRFTDTVISAPQPAPAIAKSVEKKHQKQPLILAEEQTIPESYIDSLFVTHHLKLLVILNAIVIVVLSILFGFILQSSVITKMTSAANNNNSSLPVPTVSSQPTSLPSPTLAPTAAQPVSKSDMQIQILNGGGVIGAAKALADKLTAAGFNITQIGNAATESAQTIIEYPTPMSSGANLLINALEPDYSNVIEQATDSSYFVIIIGR